MIGGLQLAVNASSAGLLRGENLVWTTSFRGSTAGPTGGGWSTRIGYEPYFPNITSGYAPFATLGPIDSLYVGSSNGTPATFYVLFESGGTLYLLHDFGGNTPSILALASGRFIPTRLTPVSHYTPVADGVLVTNGQDTPLLVQPWPLPGITVAPGVVPQIVRPFGMQTPSPVAPLGVTPVDATSGSTTSTITDTTGDSVQIWWSTSGSALGYPNRAGIGYGTTPASEVRTNAYTYKVSFVSDLGGESPLSAATVLSWESPQNQKNRAKHIPALRIPVGPQGTVARRLWRSQNWADESPTEGDDAIYLSLTVPNNIDELVFDPTPSAGLGAAEPLPGDRIQLPIQNPMFATTFLGRLFIAGSTDDPFTVFFSRVGLPEWFSAGDQVTLPATGGAITGLVAHYTSLLVLRERSLDIIGPGTATGFTATTLLAGLECLAPHSAVGTPFGVVMAARDGLYLAEGGTVGGAITTVSKLSDGASIAEVWERAIAPNGASLARATAVWDTIRQEYWLQVPSNGSAKLDLGIVWHPGAISPEGGHAFTLRKGWPVGCFATLPNGEVIFGHHTGQFGQTPQPSGLFVASARRAMGLNFDQDTYKRAPPPKSVYRSLYFDFGDPAQLKTISYVTLYVLSTGNVEITLESAINGTGPYTPSKPYKAQPSYGPLLPVYAASLTDLEGANLPLTQILLDEYNSAMGMAIPIRFSVGERRCNTFSFQFQTTDDVIFLGFTIEGNVAPDAMRGQGGQR